jgi:glycosyltransferase involved in cell wall biosynthesis
MLQNKKIAVVVPAYNEEKLIVRVIDTMPDYVDFIVVVDDCSKDNTYGAVKEKKASKDKVVLIQHDINQGVGGAIATGYKWARDNKIDVTAVMAGDAQMAPDDLMNIIQPVLENKADYTKGNRLYHGEAWEIIPKHRYLGNAFLSLLTKIASGYWHIADSQCGYTAINLYALETIDPDKIYKRYGMPNDLLIRLNEFNMRVRDVRVKPVYNVGEVSGIKISRVIFTIPLILLKGFFRRLFFKYVILDFHPLVFFYLLGILLAPLGFGFGIYLFIYRLFLGQVQETSALFAAV